MRLLKTKQTDSKMKIRLRSTKLFLRVDGVLSLSPWGLLKLEALVNDKYLSLSLTLFCEFLRFWNWLDPDTFDMRRLYRNTVLFSSVGIGSVITLYLRNKSLNGISNDQEALCRPRSAIIIGGGIIGISSALQLAKRGVDVTVIEEQPGDVSSISIWYKYF